MVSEETARFGVKVGEMAILDAGHSPRRVVVVRFCPGGMVTVRHVVSGNVFDVAGPRLTPRRVIAPNRWERCPSTHCERRGECASPHECSVKS